MKRISLMLTLICLSLLICVSLACAIDVKAVTSENVDIFSNADKLSLGIDLGDTQEQVRAVLGNPNSAESKYMEYFGADVIWYYYDFGHVVFEPNATSNEYIAARIVISDPSHAYIRNCKVGMDYHEILSSFPNMNLGKSYYGEDVLYIFGSEVEGPGAFGYYDEEAGYYCENNVPSYGVLGYYADGVPAGVLYAYEDADTTNDARLLRFKLSKGIVTEIVLYYKYSEAAGWHFYQSIYGEVSTWFTDTVGHWAKDDILWAYENSYITGASLTTFEPDTPMTRAMLVTILHRIAGEPLSTNVNQFTDVASGEWYTDAVNWAVANGIVNGYGGGMFGTNDAVFRQDLAAILMRYARQAGVTLTEERGNADFADAEIIADYAQKDIESLYKAGVINGKSNNLFDPLGTATRAEAAAILHRFSNASAPAI